MCFLNLLQGRFDAMGALLRRQYHRVAVMRPTAEDQVKHYPLLLSIRYISTSTSSSIFNREAV